ncbi:hypothetical protein WMF30_37170 [Sorangium sp. So ce134]
MLPARVWSPLRCWIKAEQSTDRLVNDTGRLLITEGDGTAQGAGKQGDHGRPRRRVGHCELPTPGA